MPLAPDVARHALERPNETAFVVGAETRTWGALAKRAALLAGGLRSLPAQDGHGRDICGPGGRLTALLARNTATFAEVFIGATASPNVCALLDPKWPPALIHDVLSRLRPDLLVIDDDCIPSEDYAAYAAPVLSTRGGSDTSWELWLQAQHPRVDLDSGPDDEPFLVTFTSGTTSTPKAILRLRRSWRASLSAGATLFGLGPTRAVLAPGPLVHGLTHYALAEQLRAGATFVGMPRFDGAAALETLRARRIARLVVVPTMLDAICREAARTDASRGAVDAIVCAGAKLDDDLRRRAEAVFPNAGIVEYYGASELGFVTVATDRANRVRDAGVGRPFPGVELAIRTTNGTTREPGMVGTVVVKSPLLSAGYLWHDDDVGFRVDEGWATVGDIGRLDETGALHLLGREGGMILTGGHNVYPGEVEAVLLGIPGIERATVLGLPDARLGQVVVAAISGPAADRTRAAEILSACATVLPRYKVPRRLIAVRDWPLTESGKIARGTLETRIVEADASIRPLTG